NLRCGAITLSRERNSYSQLEKNALWISMAPVLTPLFSVTLCWHCGCTREGQTKWRSIRAFGKGFRPEVFPIRPFAFLDAIQVEPFPSSQDPPAEAGSLQLYP